jgi:quercetin dioxygenase-like cupin family protein
LEAIMPVIQRADAPQFDIEHTGASITGLAAPSRGSKENSAWEVRIPAGEVGLAHTLDHEEIFVILSGRLTVTLGDDAHDVGPGDAVIAPAHLSLSLANPHAEPAAAIAILPVGAQGRIGGGEPFTPPWSE